MSKNAEKNIFVVGSEGTTPETIKYIKDIIRVNDYKLLTVIPTSLDIIEIIKAYQEGEFGNEMKLRVMIPLLIEDVNSNKLLPSHNGVERDMEMRRLFEYLYSDVLSNPSPKLIDVQYTKPHDIENSSLSLFNACKIGVIWRSFLLSNDIIVMRKDDPNPEYENIRRTPLQDHKVHNLTLLYAPDYDECEGYVFKEYVRDDRMVMFTREKKEEQNG